MPSADGEAPELVPNRYERVAVPPAIAKSRNPSLAGSVKTTGISAPKTHMSWKRVSNRANDRP